MAKPNYSFEKRQKEIAKKKKQEEKRLRKAAEKAGTPAEVKAPAHRRPEEKRPASIESENGCMRIWVDADACPNAIKDILFRAAERARMS